MIFTGSETPYAERMAKEKASNNSAATLILSDAEINKSIAEIITINARSQLLREVIGMIADNEDLMLSMKMDLIQKLSDM